MPAAPVSAGSLLEAAHHDGSAVYVPEPPEEHGDPFTVLLRTSAAEAVGQVIVRQVHDAEPTCVPARVHRRTSQHTWWRAELSAHNTVSRYRFLLDSGPSHYRWLNNSGYTDGDLPDSGDFQVSLSPPPPAWVSDAVVYQVFPDRFARSDRVDAPLPGWAVPADWDEVPAARPPGAARHFFGGDLYGVAEHLDHIASLGANTLYLTPVFPAPSVHRYNASSFDHVDPLLGGDAAYRELIDAAHSRGMRVLGDLTTNHTGSDHEWLRTAYAQPDSEESGFYYFRGQPRHHVGWLGVDTLPKLDHRSVAMRRRLLDGPGSVVARWLEFGLDGWRIDVANMTGRYGDIDLNHEVAHQLRATMAQVDAHSYLVGEHFHDYLADLDGSTWHGVMNYAGFAKPMWTWLVNSQARFDNWLGVPVNRWPRLPATSVMATMRSFAAIPWQNRVASLNLIGSHDTPRIASITADPSLVEVAIAAMFTFPGVPMIWAGDELGLCGVNGEDGRRTMPWHQPQTWNQRTLAAFRQISAVRLDSVALRTGGLRWAFADENRMAWLREHARETVLVYLSRTGGDPPRLDAGELGLGPGAAAENLYGGAPLKARAGLAQLPGDGPTVQLWRLPDPK